ncbi:DUF4429 domain-containing protein [Streptomyces europaeiscabiei]|uniref:DUF4429 domain-containing protein n=1 Tax=Streptomyces europaeiscabiei TaxID=146819 RepID=UPI0029AE39AC|nr:DUF4429 domain-containing protein [Streptomyces europaeiscabiei]MDX2757911.1 DUF4429 domain-containing protein [Streptomyces europaeiscabiei]
MDIQVKGVLGSISFDGEWVTITKTPVGPNPAPVRIRAADITGTRFKAATLLVHGYVQFVLPGSLPAGEKGGVLHAGRPPYEDPHSLSIPRKSNGLAEKLVAAVEQARN